MRNFLQSIVNQQCQSDEHPNSQNFIWLRTDQFVRKQGSSRLVFAFTLKENEKNQHKFQNLVAKATIGSKTVLILGTFSFCFLGSEKNRKRDLNSYYRENDRNDIRNNLPNRGDIPILHGDCDGEHKIYFQTLKAFIVVSQRICCAASMT